MPAEDEEERVRLSVDCGPKVCGQDVHYVDAVGFLAAGASDFKAPRLIRPRGEFVEQSPDVASVPPDARRGLALPAGGLRARVVVCRVAGAQLGGKVRDLHEACRAVGGTNLSADWTLQGLPDLLRSPEALPAEDMAIAPSSDRLAEAAIANGAVNLACEG